MGERLHLDLSAGARADMIAGALFALAADGKRTVNDALVAVGVPAGALVDTVKRGGLSATRLRIVVDGAELPAGGDVVGRNGDDGRATSSRRGRHAVAKPRLMSAQRGDLDGADGVGTAAGVADADRGERSVGLVGVVVERKVDRDRRAAARNRRKPSKIDEWLAGGDARAADVVDVLKASDLTPVAKALAVKAARRAADALDVVAPGAKLKGPRAARLVCDLALCAALVDELSPASITASPVAVSRAVVDDDGVAGVAADAAGARGAGGVGAGAGGAGAGGAGPRWPAPSPWLVEVLAGVPVVESEVPCALSDVAGAAFAWASVHRFGARGVTSTTRQAFGAGKLDVKGLAVVTRAFAGPPLPVKTRAGERAVEAAVSVSASLPVDVDRPEVGRALALLGARDVVIVEASTPLGRRAVCVQMALPAAAADDAAQILWRCGAVDVKVAWIEVRTAGVVEVTVPVGRGRTKAGVRVRVWTDDGALARIEPDVDDVRAAAAKQRATVHAVAAEAVAAWERLGGMKDVDE